MERRFRWYLRASFHTPFDRRISQSTHSQCEEWRSLASSWWRSFVSLCNLCAWHGKDDRDRFQHFVGRNCVTVSEHGEKSSNLTMMMLVMLLMWEWVSLMEESVESGRVSERKSVKNYLTFWWAARGFVSLITFFRSSSVLMLLTSNLDGKKDAQMHKLLGDSATTSTQLPELHETNLVIIRGNI